MPNDTVVESNSTVPLDLLAMHAELEQLREPENPAQPSGLEVRYHDDFTRALDTLYPIHECFPDGKIPARALCDAVRKSEAESMLFALLHRSIQAGSWQPFVHDFEKDTEGGSLEFYLREVDECRPGNSAARLKKGYFQLPVRGYENRLLLVFPSQQLAVYCKEHALVEK